MQKQPAVIFKKPQMPANSNQLKYSNEHTISSYKAMLKRTMQVKDRVNKLN